MHIGSRINRMIINMIQTSKNRILTISFTKLVFFALFAIFITPGCASKKKYPTDDKLQLAEKLIWESRDSVKHILNKINAENLSVEDKMYYRFYINMATPKRYYDIPIDSLKLFRGYFATLNDYYHIGITYYMEGLKQQTNYHSRAEVVECMKQAEQFWGKTDNTPDFLLGRIYHRIAYLLEYDRMTEQSVDYYKKAIFHLQKNEEEGNKDINYINLAGAFGALMRYDIDTCNPNLTKLYYDNALSYARKLKDSIYVYDLQIVFEEIQTPIDTLKNIHLAKLSCNTTRSTHLAYIVAEYYIENNQIDSAKHYLDKFALDTARMEWNKDQYYYLYSKLLNIEGQEKESYGILSRLYDKMVEDSENLGYARSYAIAKQYDDIMEREEKLRQQEKQHELKLGLAVAAATILALALVVTILSLLYHRKKQKHLLELQREETEKQQLQAQHQLELQRQQAEKDLLQTELDAAHEMMKDKLRQRLDITKRFQLDKFKGKTTEELPEWVRQLIEMTTFTNEKQWLLFRDEYNQATHGELNNLKQQYPALTEADLQYIALSTLGLTVEEMCILLGTTNRTIWNRKQTVKAKLEDPHDPPDPS